MTRTKAPHGADDRVGTTRGPAAMFQRARDGVRRAALRRRLESVAAGKADDVSIDFDESGLDPSTVIEEVARRLSPDGAEMERLVIHLVNGGAVDRMIERLESRHVQHRANAARAIGALRMYDAVSSIAPLLAASERSVFEASARALGMIGGAQSASALLWALQRRGTNRRLVAELARCAPDQFVETALAQPVKQSMRPALALAAGLRRRRTSTLELMRLVQRGSRRERVISCRALGWIGAVNAAPVITEALSDRDWKIRMSAAKALGALRSESASRELHYLDSDRNERVRKAAHRALQRIGKAAANTGAGDGA